MARLLRTIAVFATLLSLTAALLAGCAAEAAGTPEPPAAPPLGLFTAHDECDDDATGTTVCHRTASDPRMTGDLRVSGSGGPSGDVAIKSIGFLWATSDLSNEGGEWACEEFIVGETMNGVGSRNQVCVGKGGYEGLVAYAHATTPDTTTTWGVLGWIEDGQ